MGGMSLQDIVVMIHNGEYGRAISFLEHDVRSDAVSPQEKLEYCKWLAECNSRMDEQDECGDWYLEAVRIILSSQSDQKLKARQALPLCNKALEAYQKGGDPADVLVASRLRQYLVGLSR